MNKNLKDQYVLLVKEKDSDKLKCTLLKTKNRAVVVCTFVFPQ